MTACALSLSLLGAAGAQADVVFDASGGHRHQSGHVDLAADHCARAGSGRLLAVGVSTKENATVTSVTYGGAVADQRVAASHARDDRHWPARAPSCGR